MRFKLKNNEFTTTDEEKVEVLKNHFHKVFNSKVDIDWNIMNELIQNEICHDIDGPLNFQEINVPIKNLALHKVPDFMYSQLKSQGMSNVKFSIGREHFAKEIQQN